MADRTLPSIAMRQVSHTRRSCGGKGTQEPSVPPSKAPDSPNIAGSMGVVVPEGISYLMSLVTVYGSVMGPQDALASACDPEVTVLLGRIELLRSSPSSGSLAAAAVRLAIDELAALPADFLPVVMHEFSGWEWDILGGVAGCMGRLWKGVNKRRYRQKAQVAGARSVLRLLT